MLKSQITGETMIFKNDKGFYSTTISKKNPTTGTYENAYINVAFRKGTDIPNKTKINVTNGFLTFDSYISKVDNKTKTTLKIFISDFSMDSQNPMPTQEEVITGNDDPDDLPF